MANHIVAKFGGSSVRDAQAMRRCATIVWKNVDTKVVILSATYNTTNMLEEFARQALDSTSPDILERIMLQHNSIATDLQCSESTKIALDSLYNELREYGASIYEMKECSPKMLDSVYAIGERLSTLLFVDLLASKTPVKLIDAREVMITDSHFNRANPQIKEIRHRAQILINSEINCGNIVVTQGFIGRNLHGDTTTLGREGSDYSAALLGEATDAKLIQIWTDVAGVYTSDPKFNPNAKLLAKMSYQAAARLAQNGSKVLFSETMEPAMRGNIPIEVNSSINPVALGTMISKDVEDNYLAMAKNSDQVLISLTPSDSLPFETFSSYVSEVIGNCQRYELFNKQDSSSVNLIVSKKVFPKDDSVKKLASFSMVKIIGGFFRITIVGAPSYKKELQNEFVRGLNQLSSRSIAFCQKCQNDYLLSVLIPDSDQEKVMPFIYKFIDKT